MLKVAFHTLGCRVNQYETEAMKKLFQEQGFALGEENDVADVYVVNTCTVTALADRKSRQFIRRMKKVNPHAVICATGCYVQTDPEALQDLKELDIILGTNEKYKIVEMVQARLAQQEDTLSEEAIFNRPEAKADRAILIDQRKDMTDFKEAGIVTAPDSRTRANIKIQDGCDRFCTYCIIPMARGPVRSRERDNILAEAKALVAKGFKELVLTGINTALYEDLPGLLQDLDAMEGDFRVRLASLEPTVVEPVFVARLMESKRLCHHLHLSLQSGSNRILKAMNRHYDRAKYLEFVQVLRALDPFFNITTDIIVGFPGEGEDDFADTLALAGEVGFGKIHGFPYSKRPGTKAAQMGEQIPPPIKKERNRRLSALGEDLSLSFAKQHIGTKVRVLAEQKEMVATKEPDRKEKSTNSHSENREMAKVYMTGYTDNYLKAYLPEDAVAGEFYFGTVAGADEKGIYLSSVQPL